MNNLIVQESLGELVANELRKSIWNKELKFGQRLVETELSVNYGVSRSTIREALKILEFEELVVIKPRKGAYVSNFSNKDWREIIDLRVIVETYAFLESLPILKSDHFKDLENLLNEMRKYADINDWSKLFDLDLQFHSYIVELSGNSRLIKLYDSLLVQIRTFLVYLDRYYSNPQSFYKEQKELFQTLLSKNPEQITNTLKTHIKYVEGKLLAEGD